LTLPTVPDQWNYSMAGKWTISKYLSPTAVQVPREDDHHKVIHVNRVR
ncbi:hypothetical protein T11_13940, partial [Trichinella zimbabwensis]